MSQRLVVASPRSVSHPNAIGSLRNIRKRSCCMNNPNTAGGSARYARSSLVHPVQPRSSSSRISLGAAGTESRKTESSSSTRSSSMVKALVDS